jgi:hypothetical protein
MIPGLPKPNPGLELTNTFGVKIDKKREVDYFLHKCFSSSCLTRAVQARNSF